MLIQSGLFTSSQQWQGYFSFVEQPTVLNLLSKYNHICGYYNRNMEIYKNNTRSVKHNIFLLLYDFF